MDRRGLSPTIAAFEPGDARWMVLAARAGILRGPLNAKIFLFGSWVKGPAPTAAAIDTYLAELASDVDSEPTVVYTA